MPWGTLHPEDYPPSVVLAARTAWTRAAFQEHRTAIACTVTLKALLEARAPLDLVALATRFPLDEIVHVELCSRLAMELGGGVPILHDPSHMVARARDELDPLMRCADLVVRFFCVGEALSIPMLRGTWHATAHPLPKAVLSTIVRDEAAHGTFGFSFLDWALPDLEASDREALAEAADATVLSVKRIWTDIRARPKQKAMDVHSLGWMESEAYLTLAQESLEKRVLGPLRERNIPIRSTA